MNLEELYFKVSHTLLALSSAVGQKTAVRLIVDGEHLEVDGVEYCEYHDPGEVNRVFYLTAHTKQSMNTTPKKEQ